MVLKKDNVLYERDEKGKLIPKEVELEISDDIPELAEYKGETVWITPMPRGETKKLFAEIAMIRQNSGNKEQNSFTEDQDRDLDAEVIVKHCHEPSFTKEDVKYMKPALVSAIVDTIFRESGLGGKGKSRKEDIDNAETDFKKN